MRSRHKHQLIVILVFAIVILISFLSFKFSRDAYIQKFIDERNLVCSKLTMELGNLGKTCVCYFEGFKTGSAELDESTSPLCACDCIVNGTSVRIGLLSPEKL